MLNMKRFISLSMIIIYLLSFASCGQADIYQQAMASSDETLEASAPSIVAPFVSLDYEPVVGLEGSITIRYLEKENKYIEQIAKSFMAIYPKITVKLDTSVMPSALSSDINERFAAIDSYGMSSSAAFMSGEVGFDIIALDDLSPNAYASQEYLYDMSEMLESDPYFNDENYFMNIINSLKQDGALFYLPMSFQFQTYTINNNYSEAMKRAPMETMNFRQMYALYNQAKEEGVISEDVFLEYPLTTKLTLWDAELPRYFDLETGETSFDTPEFAEYISVLKNTETEFLPYFNQYGGDIGGMFSEVYNFLSNFDSIEYLEYTGEIMLAADTIGQSFAFPRSLYGITSASEEKEIAYEFIKFMSSAMDHSAAYTDTFFYIADIDLLGRIPINKKNFHSLVEPFFIYESNGFFNRSVDFYGNSLEFEAEHYISKEEFEAICMNRSAAMFVIAEKIPARLVDYQGIMRPMYAVINSYLYYDEISYEEMVAKLEEIVLFYIGV